jgi:glycosyltransferase involved in cell wall biosynthesis
LKMTEEESREARVTVIITTYNYGQFILEAIQSVLAQTTTADLQIIVVDDGSTDDTPDVLARVKDKRVEVVRTPNRGISGARNVALARAKGDFIAFLDGDDRWAPHKLEYQLEVMRSEPDMAAVFANFVRFDERGVYPRDQFSFYTELAAVPTRATRDGRGYRILVDAFSTFITFVEYPVWVQTILFRREAVGDILFPESGLVLNSSGKGVCGDIPFCFSAYRSGPVGFLREHLVEVRRHGNNATDRLAIIPHASLAALRLLTQLPLTDQQRRALNARIGRSLVDSGLQYIADGKYKSAAARYLEAFGHSGAKLSAAKNLLKLPFVWRPST